MIIFAVSPNYLRYLFEESRPYEFYLQGYESFKASFVGLSKTNASEFYGFCVVLEKIPEKTSLLERFIRYCDIISYNSPKRKRFVFALRDSSGLKELLDRVPTKNLDIYCPTYEIMTDLFIRKNIFGTILGGYLSPYFEESVKSRFNLSKFKPPRSLSYSPLFPYNDMKALEYVKVKDSLEDTIIEDPFLQDLKSSSEFHYMLRLFGIKREFGKDLVEDPWIEEYLGDIESEDLRLRYFMLYDFIRKEGINVGES